MLVLVVVASSGSSMLVLVLATASCYASICTFKWYVFNVFVQSIQIVFVYLLVHVVRVGCTKHVCTGTHLGLMCADNIIP